MMKAVVNKGLVIGLAQGDIEGIVIPENLQNISLDKLRFDGQKIVDASAYTTFYIDENGTKHIIQHDPSWQELQCNFDDELIKDTTGQWRVKTEQDMLNELKQQLKDQVHQIRKQKENEGIVVIGSGGTNQYLFDTSLIGRSNVQGVLQAFQSGLLSPDSTIHWKFMDGSFYDITIDQLQELARFALDYVEKLFQAESNHFQAIDSLTSKSDAELCDVNSGWPSNQYTSTLLP